MNAEQSSAAPLWMRHFFLVMIPLALCVSTGYSYYLDTQFVTHAVPVTATVAEKYYNHGRRGDSYYVKLRYPVKTVTGEQTYVTQVNLDVMAWNGVNIGQPMEIVYFDNTPSRIRSLADYQNDVKRGYSVGTIGLFIATLFCMALFFVPWRRKSAIP